MKNCLRVPRLLIPRSDFRTWAAPETDPRSERTPDEVPSALRFLLPASYDAGDLLRIIDNAYAALEEDVVEKLNRGTMLVEYTSDLGMGYGIVVSFDLEQVSFEEGVSAPMRALSRPDGAAVSRLLDARRVLPFEFPTARALYRDKKNKIVRSLVEEDLEEVYSYELEGGKKVRGFFLPTGLALDVNDALHTHGEPCFTLISGVEEVAAAKAHWETVREGLKPDAARIHPARFMLIEMVNAYEPDLEILPVHRLLDGISPEAFAASYGKRIKGAKKGNVITAGLSDLAAVDAVLKECADACGAALSYPVGEEVFRKAGEDRVGIVLRSIGQEDLFTRLKGGAYLENAVAFGNLPFPRRAFEGKEIGYD